MPLRKTNKIIKNIDKELKYNYNKTMANITIRNIPEEIFEKIKKLSFIEKRSLNNELLIIIEKGTYKEIDEINKIQKRIPTSIQINLWNNLSTTWKDTRATDDIIEDIYASRTMGRDIDL